MCGAVCVFAVVGPVCCDCVCGVECVCSLPLAPYVKLLFFVLFPFFFFFCARFCMLVCVCVCLFMMHRVVLSGLFVFCLSLCIWLFVFDIKCLAAVLLNYCAMMCDVVWSVNLISVCDLLLALLCLIVFE